VREYAINQYVQDIMHGDPLPQFVKGLFLAMRADDGNLAKIRIGGHSRLDLFVISSAGSVVSNPLFAYRGSFGRPSGKYTSEWIFPNPPRTLAGLCSEGQKM
jgi:hypothetical protein